jgi:drug/metabolite transporter (DMT)-like permease
MNKVVSAHLALLGVNIFYGANHLLAKGVMPDFMGPNAFIFFRVTVTALLFFGIFRVFIREKVQKSDLIRLALCGFFGVAMNQLFFFNGLELTSAINAGIIMTSTPILVVILAYFILKESITSLKVLGVLLGAIGAIALTLAGRQPGFDSPLGDLFIFINALSFGIYLVMVKPLMKKYKPLTVITYNFLFGWLFVIAYPNVILEVVQTNYAAFPVEIWWKIGFVIIGATFFTYLLNIYALKHVSPSVSGSYIYTQPILVMFFTMLFSYIGWSEDYSKAITLEKIAYMFMIFTGVYLISKRTKTLPQKSNSSEIK